MDKKTYIELYNADIAKMRGLDNPPEYRIDVDNIYHFGLISYKDYSKTWYQYPIDKCLLIIDLKNRVMEYINNLQPGQKITVNRCASISEATILKINYKREDPTKISSLTIQYAHGSTDKIKPFDLIFNGSKIGEPDGIAEAYRMFGPRGYHFFDSFNIKYADAILKQQGLIQ